MMKKIEMKLLPIVALVALMAFNVIGIHHHHHEKAVPIVVELLACSGDDGDSSHNDCCAHGDGHSHATKCDYQPSAVKLLKTNIDKSVLSQMVGVATYSVCVTAEPCPDTENVCELVPLLPGTDLQQRSKRGPPEYSFLTISNQIINSNCVENEYQNIISVCGGIYRHSNGWML